MENINYTYAGRYYSMPGGVVYEMGEDGRFRGVSVALDGKGVSATVMLTGYYYDSDNGNRMYLTADGKWIDLSEGWVWAKSVTYSRTDAQKQVDTIIRNNKKILEHNILCARYANKLSTSERQTLYDLQTRLMARNEALQDKELLTGVETSFPVGYVELQDYMTKFMSSGGVGLATWVVVVVAATVIASTATAAYIWYRSYAAESERDVKFSEELTRTLTSKLTEEEYQQLLNETKGVVTKARIKQSLSNYSSLLGYALIGVGAYMLFNFLQGRKQ